VRARAAALCALVLSKGGATEEAETALLQDLMAAARRDPDPDVRAAATRALGSSLRPAAEEALRAIARDDPEQSVRYAAERELFERSARGGRAD
jgi:HEAT repeat protein